MREKKSQETVTYRCYAKLNLSLDVYPPLVSGYHPIHAIFQSISLFDELHIQPVDATNGLDIVSSHPDVPLGAGNILHKILKACAPSEGYRVTIKKNIPIGSGMGGGSSNAAAFLQHLNHHLNWHKSLKDLVKISQKFGSDIPFFLTGGRALVTGVGEKVAPLPDGIFKAFLLLNFGYSILSKDAFRWFDEDTRCANRRRLKKTLRDGIGDNALQASVFKRHPILVEVSQWIEDQGLGRVHMSGSGSTLFLPFLTEKDAKNAHSLVTEKYKHAWVRVSYPVSSGAEV